MSNFTDFLPSAGSQSGVKEFTMASNINAGEFAFLNNEGEAVKFEGQSFLANLTQMLSEPNNNYVQDYCYIPNIDRYLVIFGKNSATGMRAAVFSVGIDGTFNSIGDSVSIGEDSTAFGTNAVVRVSVYEGTSNVLVSFMRTSNANQVYFRALTVNSNNTITLGGYQTHNFSNADGNSNSQTQSVCYTQNGKFIYYRYYYSAASENFREMFIHFQLSSTSGPSLTMIPAGEITNNSSPGNRACALVKDTSNANGVVVFSGIESAMFVRKVSYDGGFSIGSNSSSFNLTANINAYLVAFTTDFGNTYLLYRDNSSNLRCVDVDVSSDIPVLSNARTLATRSDIYGVNTPYSINAIAKEKFPNLYSLFFTRISSNVGLRSVVIEAEPDNISVRLGSENISIYNDGYLGAPNYSRYCNTSGLLNNPNGFVVIAADRNLTGSLTGLLSFITRAELNNKPLGLSVVGAATNNYSEGVQGDFTISGGVNNNFSGLVPSSYYYLAPSNELITDDIGSYPIGIALSQTELQIIR